MFRVFSSSTSKYLSNLSNHIQTADPVWSSITVMLSVPRLNWTCLAGVHGHSSSHRPIITLYTPVLTSQNTPVQVVFTSASLCYDFKSIHKYCMALYSDIAFRHYSHLVYWLHVLIITNVTTAKHSHQNETRV